MALLGTNCTQRPLNVVLKLFNQDKFDAYINLFTRVNTNDTRPSIYSNYSGKHHFNN